MASRVKATSRRSELRCPPRFATPRDPSRESLGHLVAAVAEKMGLTLMPWQRHVVDVAFEIDPKTGQLVYDEVDIAIPRQAGKSTLGLPVKTFRCTQFSDRPQHVLYVAQSRSKAREKLVDEHAVALKSTPLFAKAFQLRLTNGSEHILWRNGSRWAIDAPTRTAGHGATLDHADIDEAFSQWDNRVEQALRPAMVTRPSRQIWVYSTAGDDRSFYWWQKLLAGRAAHESGRHGRTAFFEWSAPDDADPADPKTWRAAIPALGITITEQVIASEWQRAEREGAEAMALFRRAFLNQWPAVPQLGRDASDWQVIAEAEWQALRDDSSEIAGRVVFGLDATPDRAWATVCAAGTTVDGWDHVEVVDHRAGLGWVVDRVRQLEERWHPAAVAVDPGGPAGALVDELRGLLGDRLVTSTAREHAQAAGAFELAVKSRRVAHRGQVELDEAVRCATKRPVGEMWAWARGGVSPISPLVAATLARWALHKPDVHAKPVFAY